MELKFALVAISVSVLAYALISNKAESHSLTAPMVFVTIGLLGYVFGLARVDPSHGFIHGFLELTLILVLFTDAARINLKSLVKEHGLPIRLLAIGMPLTILLGAILAKLLFGFEHWGFALLLAAILAPTDAALGQVVVTSKNLPVRIRQTLNVESGLNDGIALPIILLFIAIVQMKLGLGQGHENRETFAWVLFAAKQILLGPLAGVLVAYLGGKLILHFAEKKWMSHTFQDLSVMGLGFLSFGFAEMIGGNGFISAFIAGITLGNTAKDLCACLYDFAEAEGQLMTLCVFLLLGSVILPQFQGENWVPILCYAVLSLTLIRMIPVSLSLLGTRLKWPTHLFLGWFGPRGLASILFALLMLEELSHPEINLIFSVILATVFLSIFLHGMTAGPFSKVYAKFIKDESQKAEEHREVGEMPLRTLG